MNSFAVRTGVASLPAATAAGAGARAAARAAIAGTTKITTIKTA
jgi:hypothetical protein